MTAARRPSEDKTVKKPAAKRTISGKATRMKVPEGPERYYNRELSWLQFNARVLEEASNTQHPLLERLRFLSISASNLDEFYMVRVAGIQGQIINGVTTLSQDGLTPSQQIKRINEFAADLVERKQKCWEVLGKDLQSNGISIVGPDDLSETELAWIKEEFYNHIFPILTPIAVDPAHPFPFILNKGLTLAVLMHHEVKERRQNGLVPIPSQLDRFIRLLPSQEKKGEIRFIPVEDVVGMYIPELFPRFVVEAKGAFRVLRDSDIELEEEAEDLVQTFENLLKRRRRGHVIRLEIAARMAPE